MCYSRHVPACPSTAKPAGAEYCNEIIRSIKQTSAVTLDQNDSPMISCSRIGPKERETAKQLEASLQVKLLIAGVPHAVAADHSPIEVSGVLAASMRVWHLYWRLIFVRPAPRAVLQNLFVSFFRRGVW